jgi:hypothetical protein
MREPIHGIKVELNFALREAVLMGRVPQWTDGGANTKSAVEVQISKETPVNQSTFNYLQEKRDFSWTLYASTKPAALKFCALKIFNCQGHETVKCAFATPPLD